MPIRIDDTDARAVVIDRREAQLDAATTSRIEHELFTAWLDERHRNADVEWHWGDALRNEFGAVTVRPRRRVAVVLHTARSDCGAACLAMVLAARGCPRPLVEVRDLLDPGRDGVTALDLRDAGRQLGLTARAVRVDVAAHGPAALTGLQLPVVAHWAGQHFVVVEGITPEGAEVIDPAVGRLRLSVEEFRVRRQASSLSSAARMGRLRVRPACRVRCARCWRPCSGRTAGRCSGFSVSRSCC